METKVVKKEKPTLSTKNIKKSKIQLFMEEMQKKPMIKIVDMEAVLQ